MIGYVMLGTNDLERAVKFYDEVLALLGGERFMETPQFVAWRTSEQSPGVAVTKPHDGNPATAGNGTMVSLHAGTPEKVQAIHARALESGGTDEGGPGRRMGNFYGAYFRDLDGNKLATFCFVQDEE